MAENCRLQRFQLTRDMRIDVTSTTWWSNW